MKKVTMFYLETCPHCKRAFKMVEALKSKHPEFADVQIETIEENQNAHIASQYDYNLVPTYYVDGVKIHEGVPSLDKIEAVLKEAIS